MPSDPDQIGPYRIVSRLGAGGMGVVYRARREGGAHDVALKVLAGGDSHARFALRREVRALARLDHPGIVRVLDIRLDDEVPCYAMALVDGVPLQEALFPTSHEPAPTLQLDPTRADAGIDLATSADPAAVALLGGRRSGPVDLPRVATVFSRLCATLAFLHGEGLVHMDLKPANVVLGDGDRPVLVDFGLAGRFGGDEGRDALDVASSGGTLGYVSPEQLRGEPVDARADIYALGCMLYEALTGTVPFSGPGAQVAHDHLRRDPAAPSTRADLPPEIDRLVLGMLRKDPRDRIGHADAVARALAPFAGPEPLAEGAPRPRPYLYRSGLVGRGDALAWVAGQIDATGRGRGRVAVLEGASGVGKTRVALEAARIAADRGLAVLTGRALPAGEVGAGPLHPLQSMFEQLVDLRSAALVGDRSSVLAPFFPSIAASEAPPPLAATEARQRLMGAVLDTLRDAARERPAILVLDDAHDADDLTFDVLAALAQDPPARLLVLATLRPEARLGERPALAADTFALQPLDGPAVQDLVEQMLAERHAAGSLLSFLAANAGGNPFFVAEYLRTAVAQGVLAPDARGSWAVLDAGAIDLRLPTSLDALFTARVGGLDGALKGLAEIAAVLGLSIDGELIRAASGLGDDALQDGLRALADRQILAETGSGASFVHAAIRERIYGAIPHEPRRALHRSAIAALSREGATPELGPLALHHERAGDAETAAATYLAAGREAHQSRYDLPGAERLLRDAIRLAAAPALRVDAMFELGYRVLAPQGRNAETVELARAELAEASAAGLEGAASRAERTLALDQLVAGRFAEAVEMLAETTRRDRARGDHRAVAFDTVNLGLALRMSKRPAEALPVFEECLAAARADPSGGATAAALLGLGGALQDCGRPDEAEARYVEALEVARIEMPDGEGTILGNLGWLARARGDLQGALARYDEAIAANLRARFWEGAAEAFAARAIVFVRLGDLDAAAHALREALTHYHGSNPAMEAQSQVELAEICWLRGEVPEVMPLLALGEAGRATADELFEPLRARARIIAAAVARDAGRLEEAALHLDEAERKLARCGRLDSDVALAVERSALSRLTGDPAGAARWADQAAARAAGADPHLIDAHWASPRLA